MKLFRVVFNPLAYCLGLLHSEAKKLAKKEGAVNNFGGGESTF